MDNCHIRGREKFKKYKYLMNFIIAVIKILPYKCRRYLFNSLRMVNGNKGLGLRYVLLKSLIKYCGENVAIFPNVYIFNFKNISLGNNVSINPMCYLEASGGIEIGNDVSIAHGVTIMSESHKFDDLTMNIKDQGMAYNKVIIKDNVWIGAKVTIISGKVIGSGCVIGANAVVTKDLEDNAIYAGIPAKKIRGR